MKLAFVLLFSLLLYSCVTEYDHPGISGVGKLMVVEGVITNGQTEIKLTTSVGLGESIEYIENIDDAVLRIYNDKGEEFSPYSIENGTYKVITGELDQQANYWLYFEVGGKEYESVPSRPLITPEVRELFFYKDRPSGSIFGCVSTMAANNESRYFKWSYIEEWEYTALVRTTGMNTELGKWVDYNEESGPRNPNYYCWGHGRSNSLILENTEKLSENRVENKVLLEKPTTDNRFSSLYYIKVMQNMLSKDAYDYFSNMQKNVETTGSIFSPIPSEMKGNIRCKSEPDTPIIGFIEVSTTSVIDQWIKYPNDYYETPFKDCSLVVMIGDTMPGYIKYDRERGVPTSCADCRFNGGDKNKPLWWPTDNE